MVAMIDAIGCLRFTILCWVGKHANIIMKPTNSPTQGQPKPKKYLVKSGIWATVFPQEGNFSWVGIGFVQGNNTARSLSHPILRKQLIIFSGLFTVWFFFRCGAVRCGFAFNKIAPNRTAGCSKLLSASHRTVRFLKTGVHFVTVRCGFLMFFF